MPSYFALYPFLSRVGLGQAPITPLLPAMIAELASGAAETPVAETPVADILFKTSFKPPLPDPEAETGLSG